jgi:Methyltransferase domain
MGRASNALRSARARLAAHSRIARARDGIAVWTRARLPAVIERIVGSTVVITEYSAQPQARWGWEAPPHPGLDACLADGRDLYRKLLEDFDQLLPALRQIPRFTSNPVEPAWENPYFGGLDAVSLYSFIAARRPNRYVEIGSGFSTRFARRAIDDAGLRTTVSSIDPAPRAAIDDLCDEVHRSGLENVPIELFDGLTQGDVLVIDGSHVAHMNSDAVVAFTEVLPRLCPGVLVGIDDIFLPWDYPPTWERRWYSEQYLLAVLLLSRDPTWKVTFPAWWVSNDPDLEPQVAAFFDPAGTTAVVVERHLGRRIDTFGKTFWLERTAES